MSNKTSEFIFQTPSPPPSRTVLYEHHLQRVDKARMVDFAGYWLPVWYDSIQSEHQAVRQSAGLFDCTHMGVLEVTGHEAQAYLNIITVNNVSDLRIGRSQYSFIVDPSGHVLDDLIIYRMEQDRFLLVVNAANERKLKAYFEALRNSLIAVNPSFPDAPFVLKPEIRDLRSPEAGEDGLVDLALQGPASQEIIMGMIEQEPIRKRLDCLKPFRFMSARLDGIEVILSYTGYTGAKVGFELFVHPDQAGELWEALLKQGTPMGIKPCGLGARDSLRIEAGLPLYGHELDGEHNIDPYEAGYDWVVKNRKEFFIGKMALEEQANNQVMTTVRLGFPGRKGVRPIRQGDAILGENGTCIGWVTSSTYAGEQQVALAYVERGLCEPGDQIGIHYARRRRRKAAETAETSQGEGISWHETLSTDLEGGVLDRFARF